MSISEEELLNLLWDAKTWFENNPTGRGGYSEKYCKEKLKYWVNIERFNVRV